VPAIVRFRAAAISNSSFDQCVYYVSLGYVDLCMADFLESQLRDSWDSTFHTMRFASFHLFVKATSGHTTFGEMLQHIFQPFTPRLWLLMLALVLGVSAVLTVQEAHVRGGDFEKGKWPILFGRGAALGTRGLFSVASRGS
jgi:hypothetical protein